MNTEHKEFDFALDPSFRGVPPFAAALMASELPARGWTPAGGEMSLPLLSLDRRVFERNLAVFLELAGAVDADVAPHIKTPMSPALARRMQDGGAWAISVADLRQAHVMLAAGLPRLLLANQVGGTAASRRLLALCAAYPEAEIFLFVDSLEGLAALVAAWGGSDVKRPHLLLEVGMGRGGVRSNAAFDTLLQAARASGFGIRGIAAYEGMAMRPHTDDSAPFVAELLERVEYAAKALRDAAGPGELILTIGGSALFDYVLDGLRDLRAEDPDLRIVLRSGAAVFGDHGLVRQRLAWVVSRALLGPDLSQLIGRFEPALRLWAEVLSIPEPGAAVCGLGMRDAGDDQGNPVLLRLWRDGVPLADLPESAQLAKLNDQHGFLTLPDGVEVRVGDVVEFGLRHPCTTIDKHAVIFGLGEGGRVIDAYRTFFG